MKKYLVLIALAQSIACHAGTSAEVIVAGTIVSMGELTTVTVKLDDEKLVKVSRAELKKGTRLREGEKIILALNREQAGNPLGQLFKANHLLR